MKRLPHQLFVLVLAFCSSRGATALVPISRRAALSSVADIMMRPPAAVYEEEKVPTYTLPELLRFLNGLPVATPQDWEERRLELLRLFRSSLYGACPEPDYTTTSCEMSWKVLTTDNEALAGAALRREILLILRSPTGATKEWTVLLYTPNSQRTATPCFLGLNFAGNHAIHPDPAITRSTIVSGEEHFLCERGGRARKWQVEKVINRGFALATVYSGEVEPDNPDTAFADGVHRLFKNYEPATWGTLAAWSWGLSRTLDLLAEIPEVDETKVAIIGHSRKGKVALWAAAEDERFAMAISNNSGCGGAALSRRKYGETLALMNQQFPTWLCRENRGYTEESLPIDQHQLIALIAPRPVYVASAVDDKWADPKGEFLSTKYAEPTYTLLGTLGLDMDSKRLDGMQHVPIDVPIHGSKAVMGYHCRSGDHDVLEYDWEQYLTFAETHLLV